MEEFLKTEPILSNNLVCYRRNSFVGQNVTKTVHRFLESQTRLVKVMDCSILRLAICGDPTCAYYTRR